MGALMKHVEHREQLIASIRKFTVNTLYGGMSCHPNRSPVAVSYSPPSYTFFCTGSAPADTILNRGLRVLPQILWMSTRGYPDVRVVEIHFFNGRVHSI